mgnify:CR=1 FL=1
MILDSDNNDVVFEARDLKINAIRDDGSELPIVKGANFKVRRGEVVALIGESGSGKTTISLSALGYCKPGLKFAGGEALLLGQDVTTMSTEDLRPVRGERVAYLAQSAAATFNPSILINEQVTEAPILHGTKTQAEADAKALSLYHALELPDPKNIGTRYPHQVSGGQLQRLMAAMALCTAQSECRSASQACSCASSRTSSASSCSASVLLPRRRETKRSYASGTT